MGTHSTLEVVTYLGRVAYKKLLAGAFSIFGSERVDADSCYAVLEPFCD